MFWLIVDNCFTDLYILSEPDQWVVGIQNLAEIDHKNVLKTFTQQQKGKCFKQPLFIN